MKILVVGGAGYVGGGIVDTLSKKNEITVYDSLIYESAFRKDVNFIYGDIRDYKNCLLYTSPSPRDPKTSRMPSSA